MKQFLLIFFALVCVCGATETPGAPLVSTGTVGQTILGTKNFTGALQFNGLQTATLSGIESLTNKTVNNVVLAGTGTLQTGTGGVLGTAAFTLSSAYDVSGAAAAAQAFSIQRANQTGTQLASTISNFAATVATLPALTSGSATVSGSSVLSGTAQSLLGNISPAQVTGTAVTIAQAPGLAPVQSVAGRTGAVTLTKTDVGLGNVVNSDATNASNLASGQVAYGLLPTGLGSSQVLQGSTWVSGSAVLRASIPTNNNQLTNGAGYITGTTEIISVISSGTSLPAFTTDAFLYVTYTGSNYTETVQMPSISGTHVVRMFAAIPGNSTLQVLPPTSGTLWQWVGSGANATAELTFLQTGTNWNQAGNNFAFIAPPTPGIVICPSLHSGVLAYWPLSEASGTRADISGNGNSLTEAGGTVGSSAGLTGTAASFSSGYLETSNLVGGLSAFSWVGWVNTTAGSSTAISGQWSFFIGGDGASNLQGAIVTGGSVTTVASSAWSSIADGNWHFLAFTYDGATLSVSVDNGAPSTTAVTGTITTTAGTLRIGIGGDGSQQLVGKVQNSGVFNRAITSGEITALFNGGAGGTLAF